MESTFSGSRTFSNLTRFLCCADQFGVSVRVSQQRSGADSRHWGIGHHGHGGARGHPGAHDSGRPRIGQRTHPAAVGAAPGTALASLCSAT